MHDMAVSLLGPSGMSNRPPHFPHAQKENAGTLHYRSGLQFNKPANVSIDGPNRGHGNHHGRVAASCIARVRVADVEIIAAPRPGRRSRQFAVATLACWLIAQLPPAPSPWQLWLSGLRSGCGGRSAALRPADDVDLTLMIREGQPGQVKRPPHRPRPGMSRGPRRQRPRTPHEIGDVGGGLYHTLGALARRTAPRLEAAAE